ncbi:hypothetical protein OFO99_40850, partial [Escherichia coli]|nr:hypothetical protein [Escherichia coli]
RINQLPTAFKLINLPFKEALMISGKLGHNQHFQAPVIALGTHSHYKNQTLWLRLDYPIFEQNDHNSLIEQCYVIRK